MENQTIDSPTPRKVKANAYAIRTCIIIALSSFAYGYAGAIIATTLSQHSFTAAMGLDKASNEESLVGAINGLYYAGGVVGAFTGGWLSNRWGRKISTMVGNIILLIAAAVMTGGVNVAMFTTFRFFSGVGSFILLSTAPVWIAELSPPQVRGVMVDIHTVAMMLGYAVASYMGLGFYYANGKDVWRGPMGLSAAWPCIALCVIYWAPESPRYLVARGRIDEAWEILRQTHANPQHDPTDEHAKRELDLIQQQIELDASSSSSQRSYWLIMKQTSLRRRAWMTIFLEFALMSSGILVILSMSALLTPSGGMNANEHDADNGAIIWGNLGFQPDQIINFQAGFQLCGFVFNLVAMAFVDRVNRVWLISFGLLACALIMMLELILQRFYLNTTNKPGLSAAAAMIFIFQTTFSLFLDGASYFYIAEIWPSHLRPQGFAIGMATLCMTNMTWLLAAPTAIADIGWKYYLFFVCIPASAAAVVFLWFPDTLHKPLEEIAALFGDKEDVVLYKQCANRQGVDAGVDEGKGKVDMIERVE
ncbi:major facilitator superfamily domain-containing protein [Aspergillus granulosus]|uniref:Major facilitator superfamily domain-containing protein n=1 Tax=Aspergillus granulosus TaxID=176169 RepID=A0ABR4HLX5_9EURO